MEYFKKEVAIREAQDAVKRFGGTWHVITTMWGKFDIEKDYNLRGSQREDIIFTANDNSLL